MQKLIRLLSSVLLGVAAAVLVSCGSSGSGLIPSASAGPLRRDFETVLQAASAGSGDCTATEAALGKAEEDFLALPATIDKGLHERLQEGLSNLHKRALEMCAELAPGATTPTGAETTPSTTTTTSTGTETTPTTTTPTTPTTTTGTQTTPTTATPPGQSGGTEAGEGASEQGGGAGRESGAARENGQGAGDGLSGAGGASPGGAQ
jgi:hypothetical protein